jgi:inhibitor of cysteine peptidase
MKRSPTRLLAVAAVGLLTAVACATMLGFGCGSEPQALSLTVDDDGSTIEVQPDQEVVVILGGNPTTGYGWTVASVDEAVLAPTGEPSYEQESTDETLVGGGGTFTLTFQAKAPGKTELELAYARPWETDVDPAETFAVSVIVE